MEDKLDQILVIDIEATCWEGDPPAGQQSEIIEIGLCPLDVATGQRLEVVSILVRPERSTLSEFCTALTTLTEGDLEKGISLGKACQILREKYLSKKRLWASYGDYDRWQFQRDCKARDIDYPFGPGHINVKSLLAVVYNLPRELPLNRALDYLGFPLEGTHHRGADDAWNIARILGHLILKLRQM
jgi:inhibitor of KinA sporulation pathway (predicted exonuclease)